jgi:hypothetical protein
LKVYWLVPSIKVNPNGITESVDTDDLAPLSGYRSDKSDERKAVIRDDQSALVNDADIVASLSDGLR